MRKAIAFLTVFMMSITLFAQSNNSKYGLGKSAPEIQLPSSLDDNARTEDWTLYMVDSWGDGWDGAYMDVAINGTLVYDDITVDASEAVFTLSVNDGDVIQTAYTPGNYENEHAYGIYDHNGNLVASDGPSPSSGITVTVVLNPPPAVFFSEYAEGSSNNKYLEVYNGTDAAINLDEFVIRGNYNGNPWSEAFTFASGATLASGDVYVIANSSSTDAIQALADELLAYGDPWYTAAFNGDDVRALCHISGTDTTILDIIGTLDGDGDGVSGEGSEDDPGSGFAVAGTDNATKDYTLVRKDEIASGNGGDWATSAGTTTDDSEWIVAERPTADYTPPTLGWHIIEPTPPCELNDITFTLMDSYGDGWNGSTYTFTNEAGEVVATGGLESGEFQEDALCLADGIYNLVVGGGSFMGEVSWTIYDNTNDVAVAEGGAPFDADVAVNFTTVPGCTDPDAINYNAEANLNDGSCFYEGDSCSIALTAVSGDAGNAATGAEQWFSYTATMDGFITATTCYEGQTEDTDVDVFDACDGNLIASNDDAFCGDVTGGNNYASHVEFPITAGETYYFFWDDTWSPDAFTWYLYETPPPAGPEDLVAVGGVEVVDLAWTPLPPADDGDRSNQPSVFYENRMGNPNGLTIDEYLADLELKKEDQAQIPSNTRAELIERYASQSSSRDMDVYVTLYDSYGDGYDGNGYLDTEDGTNIAIFEGGAWGSEAAFGPFTLVDGVYVVHFDEASWASETSWQATDVDGNILAEGGVTTPVYFAVGDGPVPQADLSITSMWYDGYEDALMIEIANTGDADAGQFYVTYYLQNATDGTCSNESYEAWGSIDGLSAGATTVTGVSGVQPYMGWGSFEMGAFADWACSVEESNEDNNTITSTIDIVNPLDGVQWNVYRSDAGADFTLVATPETDPMFSDFAVVGDVEYCYYVTQILEDASESSESNTACATPIPAVNLPAPTDLVGEYANWEVMLSWTAPDLSGLGRSNSAFNMEEKIDDPMDYPVYNKSDYPDRSRQGGDTVDDATVIESLPYSNTGTTEGYTHDYDEVCPYDESESPDVVYSYTATEDGVMDVSLCGEGTNYDTKVYVYENAAGTLAQTVDGFDACNDDECSNSTTNWLSFLPGVSMTAGNTYYIVVDGYGSGAGNYELNVTVPSPLIGYNVYRDGEIVGQAPGDALGFSEFVFDVGTYSYNVTAIYAVYGESEPSNTVDVEVVEPPLVLHPPQNLTAESMGNDVYLHWDPPQGSAAWLHYDDGINATGIGVDGPADFDVSARFTQAELMDFNGAVLEKVRFFPLVENSEYSVRVYTGDGQTMVVDQLVASPVIGDWNEIVLDNPVSIDMTVDLWVGYRVNTQEGYPAGCDAGPAVPFQGDLIGWPNDDGGMDWVSMATDYGLDYNWNIQGFVAQAGGRTDILEPIALSQGNRQLTTNRNAAQGELNQEASPSINSVSRSLQSYTVYRDGESVASVPSDMLNFEDMDMEYDVTYTYQVSAVYDEGESEMSNTAEATPHNNAPTAFNLISPADNAVITITPDNVATGEAMFMWTPSADADGDVVEYTLAWVQPGAWYGDDTVTTANSITVPYSYAYEQITSHGDSAGGWWWAVEASDGVDTTSSTPEYMTVVWDISAMLSIDEFGLPDEFALHQNYPNPFNPVTTIAFDVPEQSDVLVEIYSVTGQRVKTLVNQNVDAGFHKIMWNGTNDAGVGLASGMYIYRISANNFTNVKKLIFMK